MSGKRETSMTEQRLRGMEQQIVAPHPYLPDEWHANVRALIAEVRRLQQDNTTLCLIVEGVNHDMTCDAAHPCLRCQRDAALAERDAARATAQQDRELHDARSARRIKRIEALEAERDMLVTSVAMEVTARRNADAALAEARRVLREQAYPLIDAIMRGRRYDADDVFRAHTEIAAVLAQEEK